MELERDMHDDGDDAIVAELVRQVIVAHCAEKTPVETDAVLTILQRVYSVFSAMSDREVALFMDKENRVMWHVRTNSVAKFSRMVKVVSDSRLDLGRRINYLMEITTRRECIPESFEMDGRIQKTFETYDMSRQFMMVFSVPLKKTRGKGKGCGGYRNVCMVINAPLDAETRVQLHRKKLTRGSERDIVNVLDAITGARTALDVIPDVLLTKVLTCLVQSACPVHPDHSPQQ